MKIITIAGLVTGIIVIVAVLVVMMRGTSTSEKQPTVVNSASVTPLLDVVSLYGLPLGEVAAKFGVTPTSDGRVLVDSETYSLAVVATKDSLVSNFVMVKLKNLGACSTSQLERSIKDISQLTGLVYDELGSPTKESKMGNTSGRLYCNYPDERFQIDFSCPSEVSSAQLPTVTLGARTACN